MDTVTGRTGITYLNVSKIEEKNLRSSHCCGPAKTDTRPIYAAIDTAFVFSNSLEQI